MKNNISFGRLESLNNRKTDTLNVEPKISLAEYLEFDSK